jgi:hypothetical protein
VATDIAYIAGVIKETIHPDYKLEPPEIEKIKTTTDSNYPYVLYIHNVLLKKS